MSSIRLFILSGFADLGPAHGHRLRLEADRKRLGLWTDISVGAIYGAIGRLAAEGLLKELGTEVEGNRPPRQIYDITPEGREVLDRLQREALEDVWFRHDPFDLALSRMATSDPEQLQEALLVRRASLETLQNQRIAITQEALGCVAPMQAWALRHSEYRIEAELRFLDDLIKAVQAGPLPTVVSPACDGP